MRNLNKQKWFLISMNLLVSTALFAIEGWRVIPKATWDYGLNSISFADQDNVWMVGNEGIISYSSDGGKTWENQSMGTSHDLFDVCFVDYMTGYAVGESGKIIKTVNGGQSWFTQSSGTTRNLYSVFFLNRDVGWTVGSYGMALYTLNGGKTWQQKSLGTTNYLSGVFFTDQLNGYVTDGSNYTGTIYRTEDGGNTWYAVECGSHRLQDVFFVDSSNGWVVGNFGPVVYTNDGGESWTEQSTGYSYYSYDYFDDVFFVNDQMGWIVGDNGAALFTTDGGVNWVNQSSGVTSDLNAIAFADEKSGLFCGADGILVGTTNSGKLWKSYNRGTNYHLRSVCFADSLKGWAVGYRSYGYSRIFRTNDGGDTWTTQYSTGNYYYFTSITCTDSLTAWVVGDDGRVLHTFDGGLTWLEQVTETSVNLYWIYFLDVNRGWCVGYSGTLEYTTNGGKLWRLPQTDTYGLFRSLNSIYFVDMNNGWAAGDYGTVIHSVDSGIVWTEQKTPYAGSYADFYDLHFIDNQTGWVVGEGGKTIHTTDGGATWTAQTTGTSKNLSGVHFVNSTTGWAVGGDGRIITTRDGGTTWVAEYSRTGHYLSDIFFTDARHGWAVGSYGTILKYEGGIRYWADINDNGSVNIVDIQAVANRWGYDRDDSGYDKLCDVNDSGVGDGEINIIDVQLVAGQWGWPDLPEGLFKNQIQQQPVVSLLQKGKDKNGAYIFDVTVENVFDVAAFEFEVTTGDKNATCTLGNLWDNSARNVILCESQKERAASLLFGAYSFGTGHLEHSSGIIARIKSSQEIELSNLLLVDSKGEIISHVPETKISNGGKIMPTKFRLFQNYPNPFNPQTFIVYTVPKTCDVELNIYNIHGNLVAAFFEPFQVAGEHYIVWDGTDQNGKNVASGIYIYELKTEQFIQHKKMTLIR